MRIEPKSVLFVCLGNICRSPMAEGIFRQHSSNTEAGAILSGESAGIGNWHVEEPPHPMSISTAAGHGIDIGSQRCRQISVRDLDRFDLIACMDANNLAAVRALGGGRAQIHRFLDYCGTPGDVPDPWGLGAQAYEQVFRRLASSMPRLIERLVSG
ncbi:MAG: low molecular weight protein-tyrosine-phosphatase [Rhizobiaceae bacterium]